MKQKLRLPLQLLLQRNDESVEQLVIIIMQKII
jgi:hypothetical protein